MESNRYSTIAFNILVLLALVAFFTSLEINHKQVKKTVTNTKINCWNSLEKEECEEIKKAFSYIFEHDSNYKKHLSVDIDKSVDTIKINVYTNRPLEKRDYLINKMNEASSHLLDRYSFDIKYFNITKTIVHNNFWNKLDTSLLIGVLPNNVSKDEIESLERVFDIYGVNIQNPTHRNKIVVILDSISRAKENKSSHSDSKDTNYSTIKDPLTGSSISCPKDWKILINPDENTIFQVISKSENIYDTYNEIVSLRKINNDLLNLTSYEEMAIFADGEMEIMNERTGNFNLMKKINVEFQGMKGIDYYYDIYFNSVHIRKRDYYYFEKQNKIVYIISSSSTKEKYSSYNEIFNKIISSIKIQD